MSISSDDNTDSTESDGEYDSEHDLDEHMGMQDYVDAPDGIDLDGDVDMERDSGDEEEENEEEEDEKQEYKDVEDEEEEEAENENEDDGKEPHTISQGEMVYSSADNLDTMIDDQTSVLPEHVQEMREHTPRPQYPAPAPRPQTPEPRPLPWTPKLIPPVGWRIWGFWRHKNIAWRCPVCEKLRQPETPRMWMCIGSGSGNRQVATVCPNVHLPNIPLPEAPLVGSVSEEWTSPAIVEEGMVVAIGSGLGSCLVHCLCSNLFIWGIDYHTRCEVFGSLRVYLIHSIMGDHACSIFATPGVQGTSLWWCWGWINLSS